MLGDVHAPSVLDVEATQTLRGLVRAAKLDLTSAVTAAALDRIPPQATSTKPTRTVAVAPRRSCRAKVSVTPTRCRRRSAAR